MKKRSKLAIGCFVLMALIVVFIPTYSFSQDNNCVCAECGRKCGDGHEKTCSSYQKPPDADVKDADESTSGTPPAKPITVIPFSPPSSSINAYELNQKGVAAYQNRDWAAAIKFFQDALKLSPHDVIIRQNLKNAESAETARQQDAERQRQLQEANNLNSKGNAAFRNRNWAEAIQYYREALQFSPNDFAIQHNLESAEIMQRGAEATGLFGMGIKASQNGKWAEAIEYYQQALKLNPDSAIIRQTLEDAERTESLRQKQIAKEQETKGKSPFNKEKDGILNSLKRDNGQPQRKIKSDPTTILPRWNPNEISNPQIYEIAVNLDKIKVPPKPIPAAEVSWEWLRPASENSELILNGVDCGLLAWDLAGHIGKGAAFSYTVILIAGKTIIAGAEGGLIFMTNKNKTYEGALKYLKRPDTVKPFANLVYELKNKGAVSKQSFQQLWELKQKGVISDAEEKEMIEAARAVSGEKTSRRLFWDAMLSREALIAMVRKASMEIGTTLFMDGSKNIMTDLTRRKAVYDAIRLERNQAVSRLRIAKDPAEIAALDRVIVHANKMIDQLYHVDGAGPKILGFLAEHFPFKEAEE
jgi:tetratricopeptide (TPR) repeat protein